MRSIGNFISNSGSFGIRLAFGKILRRSVDFTRVKSWTSGDAFVHKITFFQKKHFSQKLFYIMFSNSSSYDSKIKKYNYSYWFLNMFTRTVLGNSTPPHYHEWFLILEIKRSILEIGRPHFLIHFWSHFGPHFGLHFGTHFGVHLLIIFGKITGVAPGDRYIMGLVRCRAGRINTHIA